MGINPIRGQTVIVTGAAERIGRQIALTLASADANIIVHYRSSEADAKELATELQTRYGVKAWTLRADFAVAEETESLIKRALDTAGTLNVLVNNAAMFPTDKLEDLTFDSLMANMRVNAWAPFVLSRDFARLVGKGKIVNLEDQRITSYDWTHVGYILSKHVLAQFTKMTALQYAPDITVNAVAPGLILPPPGKPESYLDALASTVPLQKHGNPRDVADAVLFLVQSDFLTGEVIYVDGGRHLREYMAQDKTSR